MFASRTDPDAAPPPGGPGARSAYVLGLVMLAACSEPRSLPPPSPGPERPAAAIPSDLDLAFRIDLRRARRTLGPIVAESLRVDIVDAAEDPATAALVSRAFEDADTAWIALRPGLSPPLTDNVLVLRGDFRGLDPTSDPRGGFGRPTDLGGGVLSYDRPRPVRRSSPSRVYSFLGEQLVFVSEAELDSTERAIELRAGDAHLEPPERGLVSFAARPGPLARALADPFPVVAALLERARSVEGFGDTEEGFLGSVEIRFSTDREAGDAGESAAALIASLRQTRGALLRVATNATSSAVGRSLVIRISLDAAAFSELLACTRGVAPC